MWLVFLIIIWALNLLAWIAGLMTGNPIALLNLVAMLGVSAAIGIELGERY